MKVRVLSFDAAQFVVLAAVAGSIGNDVIAAAPPTFIDTHPELEVVSNCTQTSVGIFVTATVYWLLAPVIVTVPFIECVITGGVDESTVIVDGMRFAFFRVPFKFATPYPPFVP